MTELSTELLEQKMKSVPQSGDIFLYRGQEVRLKITSSYLKPRVTLLQNELTVNLYKDLPIPDISDMIRQWYIKKAKEIIISDVDYRSRQLELEFGKISIKEQQSRWGSCSSKRNLNFNWRLIMAPAEIMEYVIIHELAHLIELNHSKRFWDIVNRYDAGYKEHKGWLKRYGQVLFNILPKK